MLESGESTHQNPSQTFVYFERLDNSLLVHPAATFWVA